MRVLVTGGAGYIGVLAVERLRSTGQDVSVLDDRFSNLTAATGRA